MDRAVIIGASRGLGAEVARVVAGAPGFHVLAVARKQPLLEAAKQELADYDYFVADISRPASQDALINILLENPPTKIFAVAGGGPYGPYHAREWKDHEWAWSVTFLFYARMLHSLARSERFPQVIVVGSAVAEDQADPHAASYSAAKHALKGLVLSLRAEYPKWDLRLFSPGYMDTDMVPPHAPARRFGVHDPVSAAHDLWEWSMHADKTGHKLYPKHPTC